MSRNSVPKYRARVIDLLIQALRAHREIQMYEDDGFEAEEGASNKKLEQAKKTYNALLLELARLKEIRRSEISKFYPPADYELLHTFSGDLISWTSRLRSWIIKAQTDGVLPKCKEVKKKMDGERIEKTDANASGPSQAVVAGTESQNLAVLERLVKVQKSIETIRSRPERSLEAARNREAPDERAETSISNPKVITRVPLHPDTKFTQQFSQTLARAVDEYKACRWYFYQVETEYSRVLEQATLQPVAEVVRPTWKDTVDKVVKHLLAEHRDQIADMITVSTGSAAVLHQQLADKFLELQQYPLHAILQFTKEQQAKINSVLQGIQESGEIEEDQMMVDDPGLLLATQN